MTKKKKRVSFVVSFALPEGATQADAKVYVEDAVSAWAGSYRPPGGYGEGDPGDPMFELDRGTIQVKRHDERTKKRTI